MRKLILLVLLIFIAAPLRAQTVTITGTVKDANGSIYQNGSGRAVLTPTNVNWTINQTNPVQNVVVISGLDSFGKFSVTLTNTALIDQQSSNPQWQFSFCSASLPGFGNICFTMTPMALTSSQDITAVIQPQAAIIPASGAGGGGTFVVTQPACASTMNLSMAGAPPTFANTAFLISLNCNVATTTVSGVGGVLQKGVIAQFTIVNAGGFSLNWPANFIDQPTIQSGVNATTNASFWFDGTNWHAQTFPASGGGGGSPAGTQGTIQSTNGTTFSTSNLSEPPSGTLAGSFKVNEDLGACGPNPYVDIRCSGARAHNPNTAPAATGITANCTNGQAQVSLSSASDFVNNDGVVLYGCGNPHSMTTPTAPTVTNVLALGGTGTGINTPSAAGSTTRCYRVIAQDIAGGMTAASPETCTTTGQSTLGAVTVNITSWTRSGTTTTFTLASSHPVLVGCSTCGEVWITFGGGDPSTQGAYNITSATDGTHITTVNQVLSTVNGATASGTGGTATFYTANKVAWTGVTGAWLYYLYCGATNAETRCGVSRPQGTNTDTTWEDYSGLLGNQTFPAFVPNAFPTVATSDHLSTTIASGAGTTTPTLANAAGTTVSGATIRLDAGVGLKAAVTAANGAPVLIPVDSAGGQFVWNYSVDLRALNANIIQSGTVTANQTVLGNPVGGNSGGKFRWYGDRVSGCLGAGAQSWACLPQFNVNEASPGIYLTSTFSTSVKGISFVYSAQSGNANAGLLVLAEGGFNSAWEDDSFQTGSSSNDLMGIGLYLRGNGGQSAAGVMLDKDSFSAGNTNQGTSHNAGFFGNGVGDVHIREAYTVHRGFNINSLGGTLTIDNVHYNGGGTPLVSWFGGAGSIQFAPGGIIMDTVAVPCAAIMSGGNAISGSITVTGGCGFASSNVPGVVASPSQFAGAFTVGTNIGGLGVSSPNRLTSAQLTGITSANIQTIVDYVAGSRSASADSSIFIEGPVPAQPSVAVNAGGTIPVGTYTWVTVPLWQNGEEGAPSVPSTAVSTTSGNQSFTITWSTVAGNPQCYRLYWSNGGGYANPSTIGCTNTSPVTITSLGTTNLVLGGLHRGGPTMLMSGVQGLAAPQLALTGNGGFAVTHSDATLTANRTITWPDASGIVPLPGTPNTWTAANTFSIPLTVPSGGTGAGTFTTNGIIFGNGTSALGVSAAGGAGTLCLTETNGGPPAFGACSGSAATAWSALTNPAADLSLSMSTFNSLFTHGIMTGTRNAWEFVDGASTSTGSLLFPHTGASSTMKPITITAQGTANGVQMNTAGVLAPIGSGGITANAFSGTLTVPSGGTGAATFTANALLVGNGTSPFTSLAGSTAGSNPILKLQPSSAANTALTLDTAASPTGDILDINVNGTKTSWFDSSAFLHVPQTTYNGTGPLALSGITGTCPSPVAGSYLICLGDTATLMALLSDNGGNLKPIAQLSNASPAAHGVGLASITAPQINFSGPGTSGNVFISGGATADGAYGQLDLANANSHTGILPTANGGTGASSISGANIITVTGAITVGHCASFNASTVIQDAGAACGGGSSPARLDQITAATATNTIGNTTFSQRWNWALTGSTTAFIFGESAASTGASNILLQATTASASTAAVFQADNNGNGVQVNSAGFLTSKGTGGIDNNMLFCDSTTTTKCIKNVLSGISAATTRNKTWTDTAGTVAEDTNTLTLTNKTYDTAGTGNVFKINGTSITAIGGNTGTVGTTSGTLTSGNVADFDANHNIIDSGVTAANVVTAASAAAAANQIWTSGGANRTAVAIDLPETKYEPAANCVNATAGAAWSTGATPAALCRAGTNNAGGLLSPWGASDTAQVQFHIPKDADLTTNLPALMLEITSTDATNGHTIIMQEAVSCAKEDGSTTDDVAFNAARSFGTITLNGNANRMWQANITLNSTDLTGCSAPGLMIVKISRTTDTATNVGIYGLNLTVMRQPVMQAN